MPKVLKWILIGIGILAVCGVILVGVGAAVAIPNFKRFNDKAKQSEAKVSLAMAYTNLLMYHVDSERYADDPAIAFKDGLACTGDKPCLNYVYAIRRACETDNANEPFLIAADALQRLRARAAALVDKAKRTIQALPIPCKSSEKGFTIVAVGFPSESSDAVDVWSIDEHRTLQSHSSDTSKD